MSLERVGIERTYLSVVDRCVMDRESYERAMGRWECEGGHGAARGQAPPPRVQGGKVEVPSTYNQYRSRMW